MKFPMNVMTSSKIGWIVDAVAIFPVVIISARSIGKRQFIKPTKLFIVSFINTIVSEKFVMIRVTISTYWT